MNTKIFHVSARRAPQGGVFLLHHRVPTPESIPADVQDMAGRPDVAERLRKRYPLPTVVEEDLIETLRYRSEEVSASLSSLARVLTGMRQIPEVD